MALKELKVLQDALLSEKQKKENPIQEYVPKEKPQEKTQVHNGKPPKPILTQKSDVSIPRAESNHKPLFVATTGDPVLKQPPKTLDEIWNDILMKLQTHASIYLSFLS